MWAVKCLYLDRRSVSTQSAPLCEAASVVHGVGCLQPLACSKIWLRIAGHSQVAEVGAPVRADGLLRFVFRYFSGRGGAVGSCSTHGGSFSIAGAGQEKHPFSSSLMGVNMSMCRPLLSNQTTLNRLMGQLTKKSIFLHCTPVDGIDAEGVQMSDYRRNMP